jgi:hypothetical protein
MDLNLFLKSKRKFYPIKNFCSSAGIFVYAAKLLYAGLFFIAKVSRSGIPVPTSRCAERFADMYFPFDFQSPQSDCIRFERCEKNGEKSAPKFILSSSYYKKEEALKPTKAHYPSNLKSSFNPKREVRKETSKSREKDFVCMFCGRAGHLDVFCFRRKRIERRRVEYGRDSYRDEFIEFLPRSYSHVLPRFYSRASPRTFSRGLPRTSSSASPQFTHGPNHRSYGFGPRENRFEPRWFGYGPRPRRGDRFPRRPGFPFGGSFTHFELRHLDSPRFFHRGSRPTRPSGQVQRTVKTSSGCMIKC